MRELNTFEMEAISGAGWLQDQMASFGGKLGAAAWAKGSELLNIEIPLLGTVNLTTIAPELGTKLGTAIGSNLGATIESTLTALPVVGSIFSKFLISSPAA